MHAVRAFLRAIILVGCLVFHIICVVIPAIFRGINQDYALRVAHFWLGWLVRRLGVRLDKHGAPPAGPHIFVGNHRSYLDGVIAMSEIRSLPVAKAELASWPLVGYGAKLTGIIFVKRESKMSRSATLDAMSEALDKGFSVLVYPEGTTHLLPTTMDFRTGAFNMAVKKGYSIVPMAIDYADLGDAWVGDDTFVPHFFRTFGKKRSYVKIRYGEPITGDKVDELVKQTKDWIDKNMLDIRQEFELEKTSKPYPAFAE